MPDLDQDELEILSAYEKSELKSVATPPELARLRAAACATVFEGFKVKSRSASSACPAPAAPLRSAEAEAEASGQGEGGAG